jgi:hypothetical protein
MSGGTKPLNRKALIRVATDYAKGRGIATEQYTILTVKTEGGRGYVHFQGKSKRPGDHFTVIVDLATGQATDLIQGS